MPRKTKRQKLLAQLHRKLQLVDLHNPQDLRSTSEFVKSQNNEVSVKLNPVYSAPKNYIKESVLKPKTNKVYPSYAYIRNDLIRITIFTVFALVFQGVLYFVLRTR